jgi:hypothetical protein
LLDLNQKFKLKLKFKENTGDVVLQNGSKIILRGADDKRQIEKLRGPKYPIAVIDEAQGFPWFLKDLIEDILEPAVLDYDGQIVVTGTPNSACVGPFYSITTNQVGFKGWSTHKWTLRDNPHLPNVEGWLERKRTQKNWDEHHPTYRREYCGDWIRDSNTLVYKFTEDLNLEERFEPGEIEDWEWVLGIDLGYNDPTAFVTVAYSQMAGRVCVVESFKESELIPSAVAARVDELMERFPYTRIVADTGGFGKGYAEEMKQRFSIPILPAKKQEKVAFIELMNGDLQSGSLTIANEDNKQLVDEIKLLQWDEDRLTRGKFIVDRNFADHLCDALLYAWRECRHHQLEFERTNPEYGSSAYWQMEAKKMEEAELKKLEEDQENPWWAD